MKGALWGALVGDALGVPVEFQSRKRVMLDPVKDMRAGGTYGKPAGTWSDDGAMILCTVESLLGPLDLQDMMSKFTRWYRDGYMTTDGDRFDIGNTTRAAIERFEQSNSWVSCGATEANENGNGSLMRILPVCLAMEWQTQSTSEWTVGHVSALTHSHPRSIAACQIYNHIIRALLNLDLPQSKDIAWSIIDALEDCSPKHMPKEMEIFEGILPMLTKHTTTDHLKSGGYVVDTLTASLWCAWHAESFEEAVLRAVNLGEDTDTTGCVTGGLVGAYYGYDAIPEKWISAVKGDGSRPDIDNLIERFLDKYALGSDK
jgi:ADP-ribosyl-[dinitrogen reductase] hydrolase